MSNPDLPTAAERFVCTESNPWTPDKGRAIHPDAEYVDDKDYGCGCYCVQYKCPHCGKFFEVELPQ